MRVQINNPINVMSALKDQAGSKIDMKLASQMVREIISKQSD